jgi:candidapepsin
MFIAQLQQILALISIILPYIVAAPHDGLTKRAPNVVGLDFELHLKSANGTLVKRGEYTAPLTTENGYYIAYLNFGSNNQRIGVDVDTGSSDLWVPDFSLSGQPVTQYGLYNPFQSSTSRNLWEVFYISYVDQSQTTGFYFTDVISFDGVVLESFQFANTYQASNDVGILGIAPVSGESTSFAESNYPNFPLALKNAGLIDKVGYSLYLGEIGTSEGNFLFGGKDLAKIDGDQVTLQHSGDLSALSVDLDSISLLGQTYTSGSPYVLDSGTTTALFEPTLFNAILAALGATGGHDQYNNAVVSCEQSGDIVFNFSGISISVPKSEFVVKEGLQCATNIGSDTEYHILGDLFLRHAYLVYDLEDSSVQISNVKYTSDTDIVQL